MAQTQTQHIYRRSQAILAVWKVFTQGSAAEPSSAYLMRFKKMVDLDRSTDRSKNTPFAFQTNVNGQRGVDADFTDFDVFCVALALHLTDMGFKQLEVIFLIRTIRAKLSAVYVKVGAQAWIGRQIASPTDHSDMPVFERKGRNIVDPKVFMLVHKVEVTQLLTDDAISVIIEPEFIFGTQNLANYLAEAMIRQRTALIVELSELIHQIPHELAQTPAIKRGRKT